MAMIRCCVCGKALDSGFARHIGPRAFCDEHYQKALEASSMSWSRTGIFEIVFLTFFAFLASYFLGGKSGTPLPSSFGMGLLLSLVPAAVWMLYVYRQDRIEPEPWPIVLGVSLIGGLVAHAVAIPVTEKVFAVSQWQHQSLLTSWSASILVRSTLEQLGVYLAVRYTVYLTDEFDEPLDGIVYATAASLGTATVLNMRFIAEGDGVLPLAGITTITINAFVHVAAAAVLGYGLGRAHFDFKRGQLWLVGCFVASILVNGGLQRVASIVGMHEASSRPWASFAVAAAVAGVVLVAIDILTAKLCQETLADPLGTTGSLDSARSALANSSTAIAERSPSDAS